MKLCLDIGNVICDVDFKPFYEALEDFGIREEKVLNFLTIAQPLHDLGITRLADEIEMRFGIDKMDSSSIIKAWSRSIKANETSIKKIKEMQSMGIQIALLSNMGHDHRAIIREVIGADVFDRCILHISCDVGARKPQMLYYQSFLQRCPDWDGAVYVDDRSENNEQADDQGFETYPLDTSKLKKRDLNKVWNKIRDRVYTK